MMGTPADNTDGMLTEHELSALDAGLSELRAQWYGQTGGADDTRIVVAANAAARWHHGQRRRSGEPYVSHPLAVATLVAEWGMDEASVLAAILHDVVEDTPADLDDVAALFDDLSLSDDVRRLVDGLTKIDGLRMGDLAGGAAASRSEVQAATFSKLLLALIADTRVLVVKLADRLHNIRTLQALPPEKAARIAAETMDVFAPLAKRLGITNVGAELEDRCFAVLLPERHDELKIQVKALVGERSSWLAEAIAGIETSLKFAGVTARVEGRKKSLWSIYDKMVSKRRTLDQVYDLVGVRVVTTRVEDCYAVLGYVHATFPPMAGRVKDWIATPRYNAYQSLHTTVIGPRGTPIEVQIRTEEMHAHAEWGVAAHWRYKQSPSGDRGVTGDWADRISGLAEMARDEAAAREFLSQLRSELGGDEVFCFTPDGEVIALPEGATVVDFAYSVHTDIGHGCRGARVNSKPVALNTELRTGDRVEIVTGREGGPNEAWLDFVASPKSRDAIRSWFARSRSTAAAIKGERDVLEAVSAAGLPARLATKQHLQEVALALGKSTSSELLIAVHRGKVTAGQVVDALTAQQRGIAPEETVVRRRRKKQPIPVPAGAIVVESFDDVSVRLCQRCSPNPGEPIAGVLHGPRNSRFVLAHRNGCGDLVPGTTQLAASWTGQPPGVSVRILVSSLDRAGLLADQTAAVTVAGGNITAATTATGSDMVARARFDVRVGDADEIGQLCAALLRVAGVFSAQLDGGER